MMSNDGNTTWFDDAGHLSAGHLSIEGFDSLIDRQIADVEPAIRLHLEECARCQDRLAELQATVNLVRALPDPTPARSFAIDLPKPAPAPAVPVETTSPGIGDRIRSALLPALPALRVATLGVFLLFVTVTAGDLLTESNGNDTTGDFAPMSTVAATTAVEVPAAPESSGSDSDGSTDRSAGSDALAQDEAPPLDSATGGSAGEADDTESMTDSAEFSEAPAAAQPQTAAEESEPVQTSLMQEPPPSTVEPATPLPTAEATPEPTPEPQVSEEVAESAQDEGWSGWRIAQVALLALLAGLLLVLAWLHWGRRRESL